MKNQMTARPFRINDRAAATSASARRTPPLPINVLHSEGRQASAKVRTFADWLVEGLRADKALS